MSLTKQEVEKAIKQTRFNSNLEDIEVKELDHAVLVNIASEETGDGSISHFEKVLSNIDGRKYERVSVLPDEGDVQIQFHF